MSKKKYKLIVILLISSKVLLSQGKDTTIFKDYYISANFVSRLAEVWDIGIERIKPLKKNMYYASQFSVRLNKYAFGAVSNSFHNPAYYGFVIQPFHLLIGKSLKYEVGAAAAFTFYRYKGRQYPIAEDTAKGASNTFYFIHDFVILCFTNGLRYTFKKSQISIKVIFGLRAIINLQKNDPVYLNYRTGSGEIGINWRIRKKKYSSIRH